MQLKETNALLLTDDPPRGIPILLLGTLGLMRHREGTYIDREPVVASPLETLTISTGIELPFFSPIHIFSVMTATLGLLYWYPSTHKTQNRFSSIS